MSTALPVLLLPGDVFANRRPDPVLQQIEDFGDGTVTANDCFRPVSRYFDRITRPEQIIPACNRAMAVLTDPGRVRAGDAGPLPGRADRGLRLSRRASSRSSIWRPRRAAPGRRTSSPRPSRSLKAAKKPLVIAGGGVLYSQAEERAARVLRGARHSGRGDPGGQVALA